VGVCLGEAIALDEAGAEDGTEELVEGWVQRCGARYHQFGAVKTKGSGYLAAPDAIVERVRVSCRRVVGGLHRSGLR